MPAKTPAKRKIKRHPTGYVIIPKTMKRGEKQMLADFIKTMPMTTDPADAKRFKGRNGAFQFLNAHPTLKRKMRYTNVRKLTA